MPSVCHCLIVATEAFRVYGCKCEKPRVYVEYGCLTGTPPSLLLPEAQPTLEKLLESCFPLLISRTHPPTFPGIWSQMLSSILR